LNQYFQITQPTGHRYEIPVAVVANHRAAHYHNYHPDAFPTLESAMQDTVELFAGDAWNIQDWAQNNMGWNDLVHHAKLVRFTMPKNEWHEGEWSYTATQSVIGELDGNDIMHSPLEMTATAMIESRQLCSITVMRDREGNEFGGVAVFIGGKKITDAYVMALSATTDFITGTPPAAPATTH